MSSLMMQGATPTKPTNSLHTFLSHTNSSKLRRVSLSGGLRPRCSLQLAPDTQIETGRRSGGYQPTSWDFDTIQSLNSVYKEERHRKRAASLIQQVKVSVREEVDDVRRLELIDDLHWLGISCHFEDDIRQILHSVHSKYCNKYETQHRDLYGISLGFRLLRQHGFRVSQDVFDCFKNEKGVFKPSLGGDIKGLLQLYEASFVQTQGEDTLEQASEFATSILKRKVDESEDHRSDDNLLTDIRAALKLPFHWRIQIPNARSFIDAYSRRPDMNLIVLELAKLNINIVQAQYQEELKEATRWWKNTGLVQHLPFVRDRIVESYSWAVGIVPARHQRYERIMVTKVVALVTVLDDIFDVYGTLEELQLLTDAFRRWDDIESIKQLPKYMQLTYLALYNFVNETAYDTLKDKDFNSAPYLRKAWLDLVEAGLKEANWYYSGHKPSLEEYLNNAWKSIGAPQILSHSYFSVTHLVSEESAHVMHQYHDLVPASSTLLRLLDDMGTSLDEMKRGDVPKSVQCYMNDKNASEQEARAHLKLLVAHMWKRVNAEMMSVDSPFSKQFIGVAANIARMSQFVYQDDSDGFGMLNSEVHALLKGLLLEYYS